MARPPKRFKPREQQSSDGTMRGRRVFRKGRYPVTPEEARDAAAAEERRRSSTPFVQVGFDETATANASFDGLGLPGAEDSDAAEIRPLADRTVTSKYDARPSSGTGPAVTDDTRPDVVIDLTVEGRLERKVVVDLTKLPPVDESLGSATYYVRHSAGWPVLGD